VSSKAASQIASGLRSCKLRVLDLQQSLFGDNGMVLLIAALHHNSSIQYLCLADCGLGIASAHSLASYFRGGRGVIEGLDLSNNSLGDEGITAIATGTCISQHVSTYNQQV